ncbi:hypothetical protein FH972_022837 [Carpinus fangiana]|uniref:Major facilitator superfamily (MFS) profile domain-containing protein n=1 Tax=Carpinus fangiana TaxID=176857 RepID=A0A5N6KTE4_9ROSI|nr:hypothetical protein FH972_022837 [Carpinus fangiana]
MNSDKTQRPIQGSVPPSSQTDASKNKAADEPVYSIFTVTEKRLLVATASLAALFSPLTANIYYAATPVLADDFGVSLSLINLTVTMYLIFQGLAPAVVGSLSDSMGRRPLYLSCFVIYIAANIGLALQNSYAALMVLRCVQSAGSSGTVALAYALVSDIVTSAHRGSYISYVSMGAMVGPSFGPVIGGLLSYYINWQSIFWFLTICSGVVFIILLVWLPETCRAVVGNGSIPVSKCNMSLLSYYKMKKADKLGHQNASRAEPMDKSRPSVLQSFYILFDKETGSVLFYSAIFFGGYYMVITGLPSQLQQHYGYTPLQIGLCFIPSGVGSALAAFAMGRFLDWNFKRQARIVGMEIDRDKQQDLSQFPIEKARLQVLFPIVFMSGGSVIAYGWMMQYRVSIAGPMIFLLLSTFFITGSLQCLSALVIDLNRDRPSSASAAMNLARCLFGAGAAAFVVPMINAIGIGWTCTVAAGVWALISPAILYIIRQGPRWREEKARKEEAKARAGLAV